MNVANSVYMDYKSGIDVSVGEATTIALKPTTISYLEAPYGDCVKNQKHPTQHNCFIHWYIKKVEDLCNCTPFYTKSNSSFTECTARHIAKLAKKII